MALFQNANYDFIKWRWHAIALSAVIIVAGFVYAATRGVPLGIDFSGGTMFVAEFQAPGVSEDRVREAVAGIPGDETVQRYGAAGERRVLIRLARVPAAGDSDRLQEGARRVSAALQAADLPEFQLVDQRLVSAAIGEDLQRRGVYATAASLAAITGYLAIRFRPSFAAGAIAATMHDVLVTLGCVALAGYDLTLNVTAGLLTIIGYSVNDTIVVFDRIRENMRAQPGEPLASIVNLSVNQTLTRTLITAGATLLAVVALYVFGGEALEGFAFTVLVGIVSGTWSTVFIASTVALRCARRIHRAGRREATRP